MPGHGSPPTPGFEQKLMFELRWRPVPRLSVAVRMGRGAPSLLHQAKEVRVSGAPIRRGSRGVRAMKFKAWSRQRA